MGRQDEAEKYLVRALENPPALRDPSNVAGGTKSTVQQRPRRSTFVG
jgi:hypothetical protein